MLDGRFEPEFYRALAEGRVSASDLPRDPEETTREPLVPRILLSVAGVVVLACLLPLA